MNFVEPIRDVKKISQIKNMLSGSGDIRTLLMFELGINSALRASDLLRVAVGDVFDRDGTVRDFFEIREKKTGKRGRISITPKVRETLGLYWKTYPHVTDVPSNFLFFAKKTFPLGSKAIWRGRAWEIISDICEDVGLQGKFGVHTLRKCFGFHARKNSIPMELIMARLNHANSEVTKRYIWITDDEIDEACQKLDL